MGLSVAQRELLDEHVTPRIRRRLDDLVASLGSWKPGTSCLDTFASEIRALLELDAFAAHRLSPADEGWEVDFLVWSGAGTTEQARASWERGLELRSDKPVVYDPVSPEPAQRNRVVRPRKLFGPSEPFAVHSLLEDFDLVDTDEVRVLVCEDANILAWVGGWRAERFGRRERVMLEAILPALRQRLVMERDVGNARLHLESLKVTLEALDGAAFIVRPCGTPVVANEAGRGLLERDGRELIEEMAAAVAGRTPRGRRRYRCMPITCEGMPERHLVMVGPASTAGRRRCRELGRRWELTSREQQVLELVVRGLSNKTIATELEIRLRTVELHVTNLLAKSGCDGRTALTAIFWSGD
jgi:DNA-binding CsgD family transcriptional regulator